MAVRARLLERRLEAPRPRLLLALQIGHNLPPLMRRLAVVVPQRVHDPPFEVREVRSQRDELRVLVRKVLLGRRRRLQEPPDVLVDAPQSGDDRLVLDVVLVLHLRFSDTACPKR